MLDLKIIFTRLLATLMECGGLQKANYYGDDFATIEVVQEGKLYTFSMRCEDAKDGNS